MSAEIKNTEDGYDAGEEKAKVDSAFYGLLHPWYY